MAASSLIVELEMIPEDGLDIAGELSAEIFGLHDNLAKPASGLRYDLNLMVSDGAVLAQGSLSAEFDLQCVRTLDYFRHVVDLPNYVEMIECENPASVDLTDQLRDDILLALPAYPHSPGASEEVVVKQAPEPVETAASASGSVWDALDELGARSKH